jgi:dephospho-CoA kinase
LSYVFRYNYFNMKIVALVGMAGAGKSEVARIFEQSGYVRIRFGDITDREVERRGLRLNETSERFVREALRTEHGMAAYAKLSIPDIDRALERANVVVDGMYSWEEYLLLKKQYPDNLSIVAVWSSPRKRYFRLSVRDVRPLTRKEAEARDKSEIENLNKGGPIAMADFTLKNESTLSNLRRQVQKLIERLG